MASTSRTRPPTGRSLLSLLALASMAYAQAPSSVGCYSNATPLTNQGSWKYQSSGYCQGICQDLNMPVFALSKGTLCYCGDELPANSAKTDTTNCNIPCTGYGVQDCGGNNAFSVWLTGTDPNPPVYGSSSDSSSAAGGNSATSKTSTLTPVKAQPTAITSVVQGTTVVVTTSVPASTSASDSNSGSSSGGGTSVGAIAGGVVVGVLAVIGITAAIYFFLKRRKERAANEEYKRTQVGDFIRGGERKPPGTAYSQMSDSRLDPEAGARRNSHGSIADNQDYSRRILRVANPDDS